MSDLPSREDVKYDPDLYNNPQRGKTWFDWWYDAALPIIEAYRDGRLVDREAIDYEAADEAVAAHFWPCEPRGNEDISVSRVAIVAAIGGSDEV